MAFARAWIAPGGRPAAVLHVHPTAYRYAGDASPSAPGAITVIYKDLIADKERNRQVTADANAALSRGRNCLVLTNWTAHLDTLASTLRGLGHGPLNPPRRHGRQGQDGRGREAQAAVRRTAPAGGRHRPRTPGKASTAPHWTPCSSPPPSPRKDGSSSTPGASCGPMTARPPPRSTTTTTSSPASSPHPSPSAHPATPASASPTPANTPTDPALTRCFRQGGKKRQPEADQADGRCDQTGQEVHWRYLRYWQ
jgi:hypothetical protein